MAVLLRLAMWSGPRNVSTALMRSFGSRADTIVADEPLYAHYLAQTGRPHPMADEVLARHESDWRTVAAWLTGPLPAGRTVFYQKHMAHHLLPSVGRAWLSSLTHAFLVRRPDAMLASLEKVLPRPRLTDTGLPQQVALFDELHARDGRPPPVIDGAHLLRDPPGVLTLLCERVGLHFDPAMLRWEPGLRDTDGCWAPAWYDAVAASTGFAPWRPGESRPSPALAPLLERCQPLYDHLQAHAIAPR